MVPKTSAVLAKAARRQFRDLGLPPRRSSRLLFFILAGLFACFVALYYLIPRPPPFRTPPCGCPVNEHQLSSVLLKEAKTAFVAEVASNRSLIPRAVLLGPPRLLSYPFDVSPSDISACGNVKIGSTVLVLMGDIHQHKNENATTSYSALSNCANVWVAPWRLWMHAAPRLLSEEDHWWRSKPNALWNEATAFSSMPLHERRRMRNTSRAEWWLKDGVSVIAACMDRPNTLSVTATSWFTAGGIDEIVIVDWGSKIPAIQELPEHYRRDPRLVYVRADLSAHQWVLSRAYNLALSFASRTTVLKVDCDTRISESFLSKHPLRNDRTFYAGDWRALQKPSSDEHLHVNGIMMAPRDDLLSFGGYDERITTYGWDDSDLSERLSGTHELLRFDYSFVHHVQHPASKRVELQGDRSLLPPSHPFAAAVEIQRNRLLITKFGLPSWKPNSPRTVWNVEMTGAKKSVFENRKYGNGGGGLGFRVTPANELVGAAEMLSDSDKADVAKRAIRVVLQRYGVPILPKSLHLDFYKQLANKVAYPKKYAEVALELRGGFFARLLAHAAISGAISDGSIAPPAGYTGWRMREFWDATSAESKCGFYDVLEATDAEVTSKWPDTGNRRSQFGLWKSTEKGTGVEEILGKFGNKSVLKIIPTNWIPENNSRILMAPLSCGIHSGTNASVIRRELRKLVPNADIRENVGISLVRSAPLLLDSVSLISKKDSDIDIEGIAKKWYKVQYPSYELVDRANGLITALRSNSSASSPAAAVSIGRTMRKRLAPLFDGCAREAVEYLEEYPELAVIAAALISSNKCM